MRDACGRVRLAPRYAQYLALLMFAYWNEAQLEDRDAFLERLNTRFSVRAEVSKRERKTGAAIHPLIPFDYAQDRPQGERLLLDTFTAADLQMAAFWMATAAGKTHILHACLALLENQGWDRIFIITPSESLTRQHADKLRELQAWAGIRLSHGRRRAGLGATGGGCGHRHRHQ